METIFLIYEEKIPTINYMYLILTIFDFESTRGPAITTNNNKIKLKQKIKTQTTKHYIK